MGKKNLKIKIDVNVENIGEDPIDDVDVGTTEFYVETRDYIKSLYSDQEPETLTVTFKGVTQDLDEIQ